MREGTEPAVLVLEDGRAFRGRSLGAVGTTTGEAVFTTAMTGYQETLTDPSYRGQVVVMTMPHVGNTGMNDEDPESRRIWVAGYVVRAPSPAPSNWRSRRGLEEDLSDAGVVGIRDIDTRALTRHLRDRGAMLVGIFSGPRASDPMEDLLAEVLATRPMAGSSLTDEVTIREPYLLPAPDERFVVAAVDLGIKSMTPHRMNERGMSVHVVPGSIDAASLLARGRDGVFFSNGPGDPATADHAVSLVRACLEARRPVFGICFGHQMLGRALGLGTYKLRFGHRGVNQPVQDLRTGRVSVTAHNHGFAVQAPVGEDIDTPFGLARVTHVCLNDGVVEGLRCLDVPAFSVQYHPEAAAGPHDAGGLFDEFAELMGGGR
ncbi:MAG: glutamine-hydrolyzing carbamoyl-phosphate synthase small subunit [bacterium]